MPEEGRTRFAMAAVDFANLFNQMFKDVNLAGYGLRLTAPEGPSTGGGVQSLQHLTLIPADSSRSLVIGTCDKVARQAELRTYEQVGELFARRFPGQKFPLPRAEYDGLIARLREFFKNQEFRVELAHLDKAPARVEQPASGRAGLWIGLALLAAAALAALLYFWR